VTGKRHLGMFHAVIDGNQREGARRFCKKCGSALWVWDPSWPALVHPFASAIDTPLPEPPSSVHILLDSKPSWVRPCKAAWDQAFDHYPDQSLEDWHRRHGLLDED